MTTAIISSPVRVGQTIQISVTFQDLANGLNESQNFVFTDVSAVNSVTIQQRVQSECQKYDVLLAKMADIQTVSNATLTI